MATKNSPLEGLDIEIKIQWVRISVVQVIGKKVVPE